MAPRRTPLDNARRAVRVQNPDRFRPDFFHRFLRAPWWMFVVAIAGFYLVTNVVFAMLYLAAGDSIAGARPGSFVDAFFFSVQTLSTIGYGSMSPQTPFANALVTVEALLGMMCVAVIAGLMFTKFSLPRATVRFSERAVIHDRDGVPTLQFRMANGHGHEVVDANLWVNAMMSHETSEGHKMRRFYNLELERSRSPFFLLTWTALHPIDENSPLYGLSREELLDDNVLILATLTGLDRLTGQTINSSFSYNVEHIDFDHEFVDVIKQRDDGRIQLHFGDFHRTQPARATSAPS